MSLEYPKVRAAAQSQEIPFFAALLEAFDALVKLFSTSKDGTNGFCSLPEGTSSNNEVVSITGVLHLITSYYHLICIYIYIYMCVCVCFFFMYILIIHLQNAMNCAYPLLCYSHFVPGALKRKSLRTWIAGAQWPNHSLDAHHLPEAPRMLRSWLQR